MGIPLRGAAGEPIRRFETGASRDVDTGKPDFDGFFSPLVLRAFGEYMNRHRVQRDGSLRDADNWQKGIPLDAYMKSGWRHFMDWWTLHRGYAAHDHRGEEVEIKEALLAVIFNAQGYLHELLQAELTDPE